MTTDSIYAYQNLDHNTVMVSESNLNFTGTWSVSGTYFAESKDTVEYGPALYVALVDNQGVNPTQSPRRGQQAKWSALAVISQGTHTDDHTVDQAFALAQQALNEGTAAFSIAVAGTNAAANAQSSADVANGVASTALLTAWSGTAGVNEAIQIAVNGTNAATAAVAAVSAVAVAAQSTANSALTSASNAQSTADGAQSSATGARTVADAAFAIAVTGTNAAAGAQTTANTAQSSATGARTVADAAFAIAVTGTNSASAAQTTANAAQSSATGARTVADSAFSIAVAGTNAAAGARTVADAAFSIAVAGTNSAAAAQTTANGANSLAFSALQTAWTGTSAAVAAQATGNAALHANCGFSFVVDGGGAPILTGLKGYISMPFNMWVTGWTLVADQSGTIVVDILKSSGYAGFPTAPSVTDSDKPTLPNAQQNRNVAITSWTQQQFNQGDIVGFTVNSAGTVQIATVALNGTRN